MKVELKYVLEDGETYESLAQKCVTLGKCPVVYATVSYPIDVTGLTCPFSIGVYCCTDVTPKHWKEVIKSEVVE